MSFFNKIRISIKYPLGTVCVIFLTLLTVGNSPVPHQQKVNTDYRFSLNLLQILNQKAPNNNYIVSPLGIINNLSVLYVGSSGKTKQQIAKLLATSSEPIEFIDQQRMRMDNLVKAGEKDKITFEYANIMLIDNTFCKLKNTFEQDIIKSKMCELKKIKYKNPDSAARQINNWCRKNTHNRIKTIIDADDIKSKSSFGKIDEPFFSLLNAIYFKGNWSSRFAENTNNKFSFYSEAGAPAEKIYMMEQNNSRLAYAESANIRILKMYFKGKDFSLVVVLPKKILSAKQLLTKITAEEIKRTSNNLFPQPVNVKMPKFKVTNIIDLKSMMKDLGFTAIDDFASMFNRTVIAENVYIDKMKQKNWFSVDEKGAEATSVTYAQGFSVGCSAVQMPPVEFIADRPFLYFLQYEKNNSSTVLFAGCYAKHKKEKP